MSWLRWCLLPCCVLLASCGADQYEARLQETNAYFAYRQSLDRVLQSGNWQGPNSITLRIPKGFNLLNPPPPPKEGEEPQPDTRQPTYLGLELPGLAGAWRGDFPCDDGKVGPAFLFICSNHSMFLARQDDATQAAVDPETFLPEFENLVATVMQVQLPPGESAQIGDNVRYHEICPRDPKYAISRHFTGITYVPSGVLPQVGVPIKAQYFGHTNGKIQVAVLVIYPTAIRERMEDKLKTALETFRVSNDIPRPKGPAGQGADTSQKPAGF